MTPRELLDFLSMHFIVKVGPNDKASQYGNLELWWAATSVDAEPNAGYNPWMCLGEATSSYSLVAMGELRGALDEARKLRTDGVSANPKEE